MCNARLDLYRNAICNLRSRIQEQIFEAIRIKDIENRMAAN